MSKGSAPDELLQRTPAPAPELMPIISSKRRQIILTTDLARRVLNAARVTGNKAVYEALQTQLPRGCLIIRQDQLPERPLNPAIIAEETRLEMELIEIAKKTATLRQKAKPILLERARKTAHAAVSHLLANPRFAASSNPANNLSQFNRPSLTRPKHVDDAINRLSSLPSAIQKTRHQATNTKEKLGNILKVFALLKHNVTQQANADTTPTVEADWTVTVKEGVSTPECSSPTIPVRPPLINDNDPDDPMASPFVTPRSKARKRATRSIKGMDPIRFQLPR